jgi:hypothetical protein
VARDVDAAGAMGQAMRGRHMTRASGIPSGRAHPIFAAAALGDGRGGLPARAYREPACVSVRCAVEVRRWEALGPFGGAAPVEFSVDAWFAYALFVRCFVANS